jgi:hypothetical protein
VPVVEGEAPALLEPVGVEVVEGENDVETVRVWVAVRLAVLEKEVLALAVLDQEDETDGIGLAVMLPVAVSLELAVSLDVEDCVALVDLLAVPVSEIVGLDEMEAPELRVAVPDAEIEGE